MAYYDTYQELDTTWDDYYYEAYASDLSTEAAMAEADAEDEEAQWAVLTFIMLFAHKDLYDAVDAFVSTLEQYAAERLVREDCIPF